MRNTSALLLPVFCLFVLNAYAQPDPPLAFVAKAYEQHIELRWQRSADPLVSTYRLYRANDTGLFTLFRTLAATDTLVIDFVGTTNADYRYYVTARSSIGQESAPSPELHVFTYEMPDDDFLDMVQEYTFRYFWNFAHPVSGLARERNTSGDIVTSGGSGFGVMAILVGIERGYITREQGLARLLKIVLFLENADRFRGAFPHWLNGNTGRVIPFSPLDNGGDIVETAFLFEGLLTVRAYFDGNTANEVVLRQKITNMWREVNWNWYRNNSSVMLWHWSPQHGFAINHQVRGWNEAMMVYLLGIASPTHPIAPSLYHTGWAGSNYVNGFPIFGYTLPVGSLTGGPLFFAHYSFIGFDPRHYRDAYANYFVQNRNHTLINRAYCINNPGGYLGYSDVCWGLTASDDPLVGYLAHEAVPARDNGTIAPTAALSSMPYTPQESIAALKHFYRTYGDRLWGPMGFYDAFNLTENWFATSYIAIDQGPIICMIENYRTQLLWNLFMRNEEFLNALDAAGFEPDSTVAVRETPQIPSHLITVFPVPASDILHVSNDSDSDYTVRMLDVHGNVVLRNTRLPSSGQLRIATEAYVAGVYIVIVQDERGKILARKVEIIR